MSNRVNEIGSFGYVWMVGDGMSNPELERIGV